MSTFERGKDTAQEVIESTAIRVGRIATIITTAVADVAREIGDALSDGIEMRNAAKRAAADEAGESTPAPETDEPVTRRAEAEQTAAADEAGPSGEPQEPGGEGPSTVR